MRDPLAVGLGWEAVWTFLSLWKVVESGYPFAVWRAGQRVGFILLAKRLGDRFNVVLIVADIQWTFSVLPDQSLMCLSVRT